MIRGCKICGISDSETLNFIINHTYPPKFIGFICNYPKSSRYIETKNLKKLLDVKKNKSEFVAVLVKPENEILEKIKNLPFDYYQLYDCTPNEIKIIKEKYQKKIITALTIKDKFDVNKHKYFSDVTDIYLFDSKGYEKSEKFDHNLIKTLKLNKELMIAGNIKFDDNLKNFKKIANFIDLSGGLETSGLKDKSKIEIFLNNLNKVKNET
ncbi:phosphoribosylanthranilate isomerase [Candidatus Pelagibacter communis]|uniref:phosphoribosylanthranilate isomerase n=1 Tax=Pelagibacter ubique TaxID=198252 RepID=UPI00094C7501|nr:phosphoribosylanthranilate isomerase [Candidatus Pelagibacter ubique]|tara:strand:+ start:729 stop:1358 length:630 start_codon:yes stop_codon:yes gene_type:complete